MTEPRDRISILFVTANPPGTAELKLQNEETAVRRGLLTGRFGMQFVVIPVRCATVQQLQAALTQHKPRIVHFASHGDADHLIMHADGGGPHYLPKSALAFMLPLLSEHTRIVVMNSCFGSVEAQQIADAVGVAIGLRKKISTGGAAALAEGFYLGLADGVSVKDSYLRGVASLGAAVPPEKDLPQLLSSRSLDVATAKFIEPVRTFAVWSGSEEDKSAFDSVRPHLKNLANNGHIVYSDNLGRSGAVLEEHLQENFENAQIVLIMLSPNLLEDDACLELMKKARLLQMQKKVRVIPVMLRSIRMDGTSLNGMQPFPLNGEPVMKMSTARRDEAWTDLSETIRQISAELRVPFGSGSPPQVTSQVAPQVTAQVTPTVPVAGQLRTAATASSFVPPHGQRPTRRTLRAVLDIVFPDAPQLESFFVDNFSRIHREFLGNTSRLDRVNALFLSHTTLEIVRVLAVNYPDFLRFQNKLEWEEDSDG